MLLPLLLGTNSFASEWADSVFETRANLFTHQKKILKIRTNLPINQHSTVCFLSFPWQCFFSLIHLLNSWISSLVNSVLGICLAAQYQLYFSIPFGNTALSSFAFGILVLFPAKPVNSSSSNLELLLLLLKIVFGLILGACSLTRQPWHMPPYSINNCIDS